MTRIPSLDDVFAALADPTRRAMVERLALGGCAVSALGAPFDVSAPAISKQLRVLERAGLITRVKEGRITTCQLAPGALESAQQWLERHRQFWQQQLDALGEFMEQEESQWHQRRRPRAASSSSSTAASPRRATVSSPPGRRPKR